MTEQETHTEQELSLHALLFRKGTLYLLIGVILIIALMRGMLPLTLPGIAGGVVGAFLAVFVFQLVARFVLGKFKPEWRDAIIFRWNIGLLAYLALLLLVWAMLG